MIPVGHFRGETAERLAEAVTSYFPTIVELLASSTFMAQAAIISALAMVPVVLAFGLANAWRVQKQLEDWIAHWRGFVERQIDVVVNTDWQAQMLEDTKKNRELLVALKFYFARHTKDAEYKNGLAELVDLNADPTKMNHNYNYQRSGTELEALQLTSFPVEEVEVHIPATNPKIFLSYSSAMEETGTLYHQRRRTSYVLRTYARDGEKVLRDFIADCTAALRAQQKLLEDKHRYMYQLQYEACKSSSKGGGDGDDDDAADVPPPALYKKYVLSDERSFNSLFFPEKQEILSLVNDFRKKGGKFAIEGFPQKLGLLLYGPPGTGKTTFVKALATYMHRHIVSIPLGKISTNQELYDIMYEGTFHCVGNESSPEKLDFKDVIFLMEEIDAATTVVHSRKTAPTQESTLMKTSEQHASPHDDGASTCSIGAADAIAATGGAGAADAKGIKSLFEPADKLDLAGLLNILDGVVDSPGRVIIMTTNHPECLDPALVRPGRINRRLLLSFMLLPEIKELIRHYFPAEDFTAGGKLEADLDYVWALKLRLDADFRITPAEVEQLCVEHDTIGSFIEGLKRFPEIVTLSSHAY